MNNKLIQRKWALVVAILFTISSIMHLAGGDIKIDPYGMGELLADFLIPIFFMFWHLKRRKKNQLRCYKNTKFPFRGYFKILA